MNWKRQWPILLLWAVICATGILSWANDDAGETAPAKPAANQLSPKEQALFDAVKAGDKEQVKKLIADGVDVNCHYVDGFSPAHVAILRDDLDMLRLLEAHGLDSKTLLTVGIKGLKVDMCKKKQIPTAFEYLSYPLVQVASAWGSARCTKLLLQAIPKDDWKVSLVCTPEWPIYKPFVQKNLLMGNKSEHSYCWNDYYGPMDSGSLWDPFHMGLIRSTAWSHGFNRIYPAGKYAEILEWVKHHSPRTFHTSDKRHLSTRDIKVIAGTILVMIDERVMDAETAERLEHALDSLNLRMAGLDLGISLPVMKAMARRGYTISPALRYWIKGGSTSCDLQSWVSLSEQIQAINWLMVHGVKLPDDIIFDVGSKNILNLVACLGANGNFQDKNGRTRLIRECYRAMIGVLPPDTQIEFIQSLVNLGVKPNIEDKFGWRAIDYLFCQSRPKPIISLLQHGADVSHTEKMFTYSVISYLIEEYTDLAVQFMRYQLASPFTWRQGKRPLPLQFGTLPRHNLQWQETPLLPFLQLLLKNGADVNFVSNNGLTPLMEAAMIGRIDVVVLLVEKGADIGMKARKPTTGRYPGIWTGKTAIELTAKGHPEIREYLMQMAGKRGKTR